MSVEFSGVSTQRLLSISLQLEAGVHVVLGGPSDGSLELLQVGAGELQPASGNIRIAGENPRTTPRLRRSLGCALMASVWEEATVAQAVACRLALHGCSKSAKQAFARFGAEQLLDRRPKLLTPRERHLVGLLVALALDQPKALLLHEPLLSSMLIRTDELLAALAERAERTVVICTTASARIAAILSPTAIILEGGRLKRRTLAPTRPAFTPGSPARVHVQSSASEKLAQALSHVPAVTGIRWHSATSLLIVEGPQVEKLCHAILTAAVDLEVDIHQLTQALPETSEIRATHAALARAAYERTYGNLAAQASGGR